MHSFTFTLDFAPPFRLDLTAWALRRRPENQIDRFDDGVHSRIFAVGETPVVVSLSQPAGTEQKLQTRVEGIAHSKTRQSWVTRTIERMLGLHLDLSPFYHLALRDARLRPLVDRFLGLKPPRFPTAFEAAMNGIACQQLSLNVGIALLNRLSEACSPSVETRAGFLRHAFPRPEDVLTLTMADLRTMGFSTRKAGFILELSGAVAEGRVDLENLEGLTREKALELLTRIRGIGRWTAEYVLLRGVGDLTAFPGDDVGGRNKLRRWLDLSEPLSYEGVQKLTDRWKPFPGLIYFHLLLDELAGKGLVRP